MQDKCDPNYSYCADDIDSYLSYYINSGYNSVCNGYAPNCKYLVHETYLENNLDYYVVVIPSMSATDIYHNRHQSRLDEAYAELMIKLLELSHTRAKILFPYHLGGCDWLLGEVKLVKSEQNYDITVFAHSPLGGGELEALQYKTLADRLSNRIREFDAAAVINCSNSVSPYSPRQSEADRTSSGVIVADDLFKRIWGDSLDIPQPHPLGCVELRTIQQTVRRKESRIENHNLGVENIMLAVGFFNNNNQPSQGPDLTSTTTMSNNC